MRLTRRFAFALVLAAACSGSDAVGPTPSSSFDLARVFGELAVPGASVAATLAAAPGVPTMTFTLTGLPTTCPYAATSKSFVCAPTSTNGVSVSLSYQLFDAAGNAQSQGDPATTNAVRTLGSVSGVLQPASTGTNSAGAITIAQQHDLTISGLLGDTHTIDGTATTTFGGSFATNPSQPQQITAIVTETTTQTLAHVRIPARPAGTNAYPLGGTITSDATSTTNGQVLTVHSVVTFNGTSTATLSVTIGGTTQSCTVSLAGVAAPVCH